MMTLCVCIPRVFEWMISDVSYCNCCNSIVHCMTMCIHKICPTHDYTLVCYELMYCITIFDVLQVGGWGYVSQDKHADIAKEEFEAAKCFLWIGFGSLVSFPCLLYQWLVSPLDTHGSTYCFFSWCSSSMRITGVVIWLHKDVSPSILPCRV